MCWEDARGTVNVVYSVPSHEGRPGRERAAEVERARREVREERVRIARELHDVVAHALAVITVQAGVGRRLMVGRPEDRAGLTDPPESIAAGGLLPSALAAAGVAPADISTVFLTHLHADHIGVGRPRWCSALSQCGGHATETQNVIRPPRHAMPSTSERRSAAGACG